MSLTITGVFRSDHRNFISSLPPSAKNPGGGVAVKVLNLKLAVPTIEIVGDISEAGIINITEPLWFTERAQNDSFESRIRRYKASKSFKILWTSDLEFARWNGAEREEIFDATDVIAGNSLYMVQILRSFTPDVALLTDPIDANFVSPEPKEPRIFGMSNIAIEKNISAIIDIYQALPPTMDLHKGFIGSSDIWGLDIRNKASKQLEGSLIKVCDWHIPNATRLQVSKTIAPCWGFITDTRYDTFCYSMVEAMLAGCWCFCGKHAVFNERPVIRFNTTEEAVERIKTVFADGMCINEDGRQFVIDNYSLPIFRSQLKEIVGGRFGI